MAYPHTAGASFNLVCNLEFEGDQPGGEYGVFGNQPDYSQWTVTAGMFDQDGINQYSSILITNYSNPDSPITNGLVSGSVSAAETANWTRGKAQLIFKCITDTGTVLLADPIWYSIKASPMGGSQ